MVSWTYGRYSRDRNAESIVVLASISAGTLGSVTRRIEVTVVLSGAAVVTSLAAKW